MNHSARDETDDNSEKDPRPLFFSSSLSDAQADLLVKTRRPIVLMLDGNEAGQQGMRAAAGKLITQTFARVVKLPGGCEPDDLSADELRSYLD